MDSWEFGVEYFIYETMENMQQNKYTVQISYQFSERSLPDEVTLLPFWELKIKPSTKMLPLLQITQKINLLEILSVFFSGR
jgi:hypothetical protein